MAVITKQDMAPFRNTRIIEPDDFSALAEISRQLKLKRNETGFSAMHMRNFTLNQNSCSPETKEAILKYFQDKLLNLKKEVDKVFK